MKETNVGNKIVIAERDNIAAVMENGKVSEFHVAPFLWNAHPAMCKVPSSLLEDEIHTVRSPLSPKGTCNTQRQTV